MDKALMYIIRDLLLRSAPLALVVLVSCSSSSSVQLNELPVPDPGEKVNVYSLIQSYELSKGSYSSYDKHEWEKLGRFYVFSRSAFLDENLVYKLIDYLGGGLTTDPERVVMCFNPRYAMTYKTDGSPVEIFVSFECEKLLLKIDGRKQFFYIVDSKDRLKINEIYESLGVKLPSSR